MAKDNSHTTSGEDPDQRTHRFGFTAVAESERQAKVNKVFAKVASRYDLMNDLMSGGLHRAWKNDLMAWLNPPRGQKPFTLLDVAGGTGDISRRFLATSGTGGRCIICDISGEMLKAGKSRCSPEERARLRYLQANAEILPLASNSIDAYTIGFGIRNVTHIDRALSEACRVLRPGGRFLCLEFSEVQVPILDSLYDRYSFSAIPAIGGIVAGDMPSYRYLVESIRSFPDQNTFADMIRTAGFDQVSYRNLTGGVAAIHSGWKL